MSSFFEYVGQCMPQLTLGLKLTLQMTVFSLILAVVVGMVMCLFSISKVKPLNWPDSWDSTDGTGILHLFLYHRCVPYPDYIL